MEHNENVKVRTGGESLWKKVQGTKRGWYCAFMWVLYLFDLYLFDLYSVLTLTDIIRPLRDHVATVTAYLNDYKNPHRTERELGEYSIYFTSYLISTCWPKMVRQIQSWKAMGFIYLLNSISVRQLEIFGWFWGGFQAGPCHGDKMLRSFLLNLKPQLKRNLLLASDRDENDRVLNYTEDDFPWCLSPTLRNLFFQRKLFRNSIKSPLLLSKASHLHLCG